MFFQYFRNKCFVLLSIVLFHSHPVFSSYSFVKWYVLFAGYTDANFLLGISTLNSISIVKVLEIRDKIRVSWICTLKKEFFFQFHSVHN